MGEPEVAVVYSPRDWVEKLDRFVVDHGGARVRAKVVDRRDAVEERYDVLVVDDTTAFLSRRFVEDLHRMGRRVLGVFDAREYATSDQLTAGMERLRQSGVDDVIEAVAAPLDFVAAIEALAVTSDDRLERELAQLGAHPIPPETAEPAERPARGFVTVVAGASGGCGATEVAVGLAGAVVRRGESAVLVDADDVSPSVAQRLGLPLYPNLRAAVDAVEHGAGELTGCLSTVPAGGFDVLCGFSRPKDWASIRPIEVFDVVRSLAGARHHVVVNVGHRVENLGWLGEPERYGLTRTLIGEADALVGVAAPSPVGVARLLAWASEVRSFAPDTAVHLVINRAPGGKFRRGELGEEISRSLTPSSVSFLSHDERVDAAAWAGQPVSRGPFTKAVDRLASVAIPRLLGGTRGRRRWRLR